MVQGVARTATTSELIATTQAGIATSWSRIAATSRVYRYNLRGKCSNSAKNHDILINK
ncbi:hypothetical protein [Jeotgalibacillus sp. JSM ZJ347]|uniref:hypothetical protein n=1 Tax=Jeotgalibacillus sp. JSM ZJ347 TaxID=3342117 RepID=UPI0035A88342